MKTKCLGRVEAARRAGGRDSRETVMVSEAPRLGMTYAKPPRNLSIRKPVLVRFAKDIKAHEWTFVLATHPSFGNRPCLTSFRGRCL